MRTSSGAGKTLLLALLCATVSACGKGPLLSESRAGTEISLPSAADPQVRAFYAARQGEAAWDRKSEKRLLAVIAHAPENGLKPDLFLPGDLPRDRSDREVALTDAALRYAAALAHGYADPRKINALYTIPRPAADVAKGLANALAKDDLEGWYASLAPQTDEYRALSQAHLTYLGQAGRMRLQPIPAGKPIKPGRRDARLPAIASALSAMGYLATASSPQRYEPALVAAVKRLQSDWSMTADGVIGATTLSVLNRSPAGLARQTAVNMERLRWLERAPPATRIDVNTAAAVLDYWRDGRLADRRNVVVGEPDKQTPQLQASFNHLVANPKWRVPETIAAKELAAKSEGWLQDNGFTVENGRYVQDAGDKNSLGLVKFDMTDPQQIYLHDTPAKALFAAPERHRSHGCVRVEDALGFAALLTSQDDVTDKFDEAMMSGEEKWVRLKTRIPVRLLYRTAFLDEGRVRFRPDVYGWDDAVAMAIGLVRGGPREMIPQQPEDVGP